MQKDRSESKHPARAPRLQTGFVRARNWECGNLVSDLPQPAPPPPALRPNPEWSAPLPESQRTDWLRRLSAAADEAYARDRGHHEFARSRPSLRPAEESLANRQPES